MGFLFSVFSFFFNAVFGLFLGEGEFLYAVFAEGGKMEVRNNLKKKMDRISFSRTT